jgi:hypothetical protein
MTTPAKNVHTNLRNEISPIRDRFEKRKPAILASLRAAHQQGPSTQPFNEKGALDDLKMFSCVYIGRVFADKLTRPSPDIRERFNKLAVDLEQVDVALGELLDGRELRYVLDAGEKIGVEVIQDICISLKSLPALATAVRAACKGIPLKRGRPRDRALWPAEAEGLAELYAEHTGCKPGSGEGPFARFVYSVVSALGQNVSKGHVIDVIKGAHLAREQKVIQGQKVVQG